MGVGFKVETRTLTKFSKCIIVCNYDIYNLVINWGVQSEPFIKTSCDVGMWKIKQLKN